jgi:hypothetical protein
MRSAVALRGVTAWSRSSTGTRRPNGGESIAHYTEGWFRDSACQRRHGKGTVKPYDNLGRAVDVMREHFVRRVPVVDEW